MLLSGKLRIAPADPPLNLPVIRSGRSRSAIPEP
jgi:hypothetical protein